MELQESTECVSSDISDGPIQRFIKAAETVLVLLFRQKTMTGRTNLSSRCYRGPIVEKGHHLVLVPQGGLGGGKGPSHGFESKPPAPSEQVSANIDELSDLTLLKVSDLVEVLRDRLGITEMLPTMMVMMPGMVPGGLKGKGGGAAKKVEEKA
nr:hypothetical protein CFP56_14824 [Quercus suber]